MAERGGGSGGATGRGTSAAGREFIGLVIDYAKQETLGPLKDLLRFVAFGVAGSVALSVGVVVLVVALLRALQTETGTTFGGNLSWLPYVMSGAAAVLVAALAGWRITKGAAARTARPPGGDRRD